MKALEPVLPAVNFCYLSYFGAFFKVLALKNKDREKRSKEEASSLALGSRILSLSLAREKVAKPEGFLNCFSNLKKIFNELNNIISLFLHYSKESFSKVQSISFQNCSKDRESFDKNSMVDIHHTLFSQYLYGGRGNE